MINISVPEGYYSEKEMAEFLGKTLSSLRTDHSRRRNRVPPKTKIGNLIIYSKASFETWLKLKEIKPVEIDVRIKRRGF
jgi:hypothetical protein